MANEPGVKQRASRRGLRSINGKFYHTIQERNAADRAFNKAKAAKKSEAASAVIEDINKDRAAKGEKPFDFAYKQEEIVKPAAATYHCVNCKQPVDYKTLVCPNCHQRLNWEGL